MMPPARCTSSMWTSATWPARPCTGTGTRARQRDRCRPCESTPPSCAAARMCSTVLVEPPMAMSSAMAFSNARLGGDRCAAARSIVLLVVALGQLDDQAAGLHEQPLAVGMRGQGRAVAGQRQAERLGQAVHRVGGEHAGAGAAGRAGRPLDGGDFLVGDTRRRQRRPSRRPGRAPRSCRAASTLPASIGPPETNTAGMLSRIAAISMPGVILSQLEMQTIASAQWALTMYSTQSAISSRDGSE